jgi:phasin family protein
MNQQQQMEALAAANAANVDAMRSLAFASIEATERLLSLNLGLARNSVRLSADYVRPATGTDWKSVLAHQSSGLQNMAEEAAGYLRSVYDISSKAQADTNEVISARVEDITDSMNTVLDTLAQSAPLGSGKALDLIRSAFSASCSAYTQMVRSAPQASSQPRGKSRKS